MTQDYQGEVDKFGRVRRDQKRHSNDWGHGDDSRKHEHFVQRRAKDGEEDRRRHDKAGNRYKDDGDKNDDNYKNQHDRNSQEYYGPAHLDPLQPGTVVQGTVTRLESYGAFVDFVMDPRGPQHRGLVHIGQLASHRVEKVADIVTVGQSVYCVILDAVEPRRIRLGMKDVDQLTGRFLGDATRRGDRPPPPSHPRELERRAKQRRELFLQSSGDWKEHAPGPAYLRKLWSPSPEPPSQPASKAKVEVKKKEMSASSAESVSSSPSSTSSTSEDRKNRRKRKRSRGTRNDRSRKQSSQRRRRRRRYESSSSDDSSSGSSTSESSSSSSSSSSPSSRNENRDKKKSKLEPTPALPDIATDDIEWKEAQALKETIQAKSTRNTEDSDEEGPKPLMATIAAGTAATANSSYGKALLPGEGQAIAQYVQQNLRIPRRGEIGYSGDDIEQFERTGYVMSGSRHTRMNAVRIRKENQVYSAEEQRALALITMEENQQKEAQLMEDFRTMLKEKKKLLQQGKTS